MKIIDSQKPTQSCKRIVVEAFGGSLPPGFKWKRSSRRGVIFWELSDNHGDTIARVVNNRKNRKIELDGNVFKTKTKNRTITKKSRTKNPIKRRRRRPRVKQFPPPFKASDQLLDKLVEKYRIHENPDPPDCKTCGLKYRDLRTGLDFKDVQDMLFVETSDPDMWRQKGRHSVLGLWFEIKRNMWNEHIALCGDKKGQKRWLSDFDPDDFADY